MARVPGTETHSNRAGWHPGQVARCRRSRANAERGLADQRGFVVEVRPRAARLLLDRHGRSVWLENEALLAESELADAELELLRRVFVRLGGQRLEIDDEGLTVYGGAFPVEVTEQVRRLLGDRLVGYEIQPAGVHELATRLALRP